VEGQLRYGDMRSAAHRCTDGEPIVAAQRCLSPARATLALSVRCPLLTAPLALSVAPSVLPPPPRQAGLPPLPSDLLRRHPRAAGAVQVPGATGHLRPARQGRRKDSQCHPAAHHPR
jgi:hypothetical protein